MNMEISDSNYQTNKEFEETDIDSLMHLTYLHIKHKSGDVIFHAYFNPRTDEVWETRQKFGLYEDARHIFPLGVRELTPALLLEEYRNYTNKDDLSRYRYLVIDTLEKIRQGIILVTTR